MPRVTAFEEALDRAAESLRELSGNVSGTREVLALDLARLESDERRRELLPSSVDALRLELELAGPARREMVLRLWRFRVRLAPLAVEAAALAREALLGETIRAETFRRADELRAAVLTLREECRALGEAIENAMQPALDEAERSCVCVASGGKLVGGRQVVDLLELLQRPADPGSTEAST